MMTSNINIGTLITAPPRDNINPNVYSQFSNGAQLIDITENLNGNGAQAVSMIGRATRADGQIKSDPVEDLLKAKWFIERELFRRDPAKFPNPATANSSAAAKSLANQGPLPV